MKKLLAMLLVVVMVLSLCACNADPKETTQSTTKATEGTTAATEGTTAAVVDEAVYPIVKEGDEPITIKALVTADTSVSDDRTVWQKVEEVTGINIEYERIDAEALTTYLAGNEWPDIFITNISKTLLTDYGVLGGRFVNYLDYLEYMPNLQKTFEDYPSSKAIYYRAKHVEFVTGVSDIEKDWDAYIAEFEKMNLSGLLEVYQAAYDRFMANM